MEKGRWKGLEKQIQEGKVVPGKPVLIGSREEIQNQQKRAKRILKKDYGERADVYLDKGILGSVEESQRRQQQAARYMERERRQARYDYRNKPLAI